MESIPLHAAASTSFFLIDIILSLSLDLLENKLNRVNRVRSLELKIIVLFWFHVS